MKSFAIYAWGIGQLLILADATDRTPAFWITSGVWLAYCIFVVLAKRYEDRNGSI